MILLCYFYWNDNDALEVVGDGEVWLHSLSRVSGCGLVWILLEVGSLEMNIHNRLVANVEAHTNHGRVLHRLGLVGKVLHRQDVVHTQVWAHMALHMLALCDRVPHIRVWVGKVPHKQVLVDKVRRNLVDKVPRKLDLVCMVLDRKYLDDGLCHGQQQKTQVHNPATGVGREEWNQQPGIDTLHIKH